MKILRKHSQLYRSTSVVASMKIDSPRNLEDSYDYILDSKPWLKDAILEIASSLDFDDRFFKGALKPVDVYQDIYIHPANVERTAWAAEFSGLCDFNKWVVDLDLIDSEIVNAIIPLQHWCFDKFYYIIDSDGSYRLDDRLGPFDRSVKRYIDIYNEAGPSSSRIKFFDSESEAKAFLKSLKRGSDSEATDGISRQRILSDAKDFFFNSKGIRFRILGVDKDSSDVSLQDLQDGNYTDEDRINYRVKLTYNGNTATVNIEYVCQDGEWLCTNNEYDNSDVAYDILQNELNYPL